MIHKHNQNFTVQKCVYKLNSVMNAVLRRIHTWIFLLNKDTSKECSYNKKNCTRCERRDIWSGVFQTALHIAWHQVKHSISEVLIQSSTHPVKYLFSEVLIQ